MKELQDGEKIITLASCRHDMTWTGRLLARPYHNPKTCKHLHLLNQISQIVKQKNKIINNLMCRVPSRSSCSSAG